MHRPESTVDPVNSAISRTLAVGSLIAAGVLAAGLAAWLATGAPPTGSHDLPGWLGRLLRLEPAAAVFAGLALVTLTPVAQLGAAVIALRRNGERRHAAVAGAVLAVIVASVVIAIALSGAA